MPDNLPHHAGDCDWYRVKVCTCGLFARLVRDPGRFPPEYAHDFAEHEDNLLRLQELQRENPA